MGIHRHVDGGLQAEQDREPGRRKALERIVVAQRMQQGAQHDEGEQQQQHQAERDAADVHGARLRGQLEDPLDLFRRVVDPGHERRDQDAGRYPGAVELRDRLEPRARVGRMRCWDGAGTGDGIRWRT